MTKWRQHIVIKLFLITSSLLVLISSIIYLAFYFFLPTFYQNYKLDTLEKGITQLENEITELSLNEARPYINNFSAKTNTEIIVVDKDEKVVYLPSYLNQLLESGESGPAIAKPIFPPLIGEPGTESENNRVQITNIQLDLADGTYKAILRTSLQPVDEVPLVIVDFLPYLLIVIVLLTFCAALIYSRITAKPLLELNRIAKKMAKMDFSESTKVNGQDELGQLGTSLNQLSINLQQHIAALKTTNAQLQNDIERERQIELARREFIAIISHELKSPITVVKGQLEAMLHNIGPFKDRDTYLKRSYDIAEHMEGLVLELLSISELEQPNYLLQRQTVPLHSLIKSVIQSQEYFIHEKSLNIEVDLNTINIIADRSLLSKAIRNVIQNAIKYSPKGGTVKISLKDENGVHISVWNESPFISDEQIQRIFEPFYRIEQSRNRATGGSGLGLYITKKILDLHEFSYHFSNMGEGVCFELDIDSKHITEI